MVWHTFQKKNIFELHHLLAMFAINLYDDSARMRHLQLFMDLQECKLSIEWHQLLEAFYVVADVMTCTWVCQPCCRQYRSSDGRKHFTKLHHIAFRPMEERCFSTCISTCLLLILLRIAWFLLMVVLPAEIAFRYRSFRVVSCVVSLIPTAVTQSVHCY